ncbi:hypothetical protein ACFFKB_04545 [Mameliella alba]|uniref:hypothetical protein n=1 Tax=Mameliella alba TaxID=561184 RepID=UPI00105469B0|nr:hypothetical protein [Mameliella alba]
MSPDEIAKRAEATAKRCDEQGFFSTAKALRTLVCELGVSGWLSNVNHDAKLQQNGATSKET